MLIISATQEGARFETSQGKKIARLHFNQQIRCGAGTCGPSYMGGYREEDHTLRPAWAKRYYLKNH
jgi:hypothetical protein